MTRQLRELLSTLLWGPDVGQEEEPLGAGPSPVTAFKNQTSPYKMHTRVSKAVLHKF